MFQECWVGQTSEQGRRKGKNKEWKEDGKEWMREGSIELWEGGRKGVIGGLEQPDVVWKLPPRTLLQDHA